MATVNDNFNRADEAPLASPWAGVTGAGSMSLFSNSARVFQTGPDEYEVYTGSGIGGDQYAQATITTIGAGVAGLLVRFASGSKAGYRFYGDATSTQIDRQPGGTNIGSPGAGLNNGDVVKLEAVGTTINLYVNGVLRCTGTDATYASGNPGMFAVGTAGGNPILDNFSAGDVGSGSAGKASKVVLSSFEDELYYIDPNYSPSLFAPSPGITTTVFKSRQTFAKRLPDPNTGDDWLFLTGIIKGDAGSDFVPSVTNVIRNRTISIGFGSG